MNVIEPQYAEGAFIKEEYLTNAMHWGRVLRGNDF